MIGKTILHYRIIEKLGEGGMGVVYKAGDTKLKREVAIKFLPRYITSNKEERKRFEIEAQAAASLNHPGIATIHAIEEVNDDIFIVMEFIDGVELKDKIKSESLPVTIATDLAIQIAEGLEAAHNKGIVHRDIKSGNIMITGAGKIKIMDFGLAKIGKGSDLTKSGSTVGTIAYMSPEQARGAEVDHRTDLWSFGVVLYEMLTGKLPFKGEYDAAIIYNILNEEPQLDIVQNPAQREVVKKCLEKDKSNRYQSMAEILKDLQGTKQASGNAAPEIRAEEKKKNSKRKLLTTIGAAAIVMFLAAYFIFLNSNDDSGNTYSMKTTRLTSFSGEEYHPALSPDGKSVAFSWNGLQQDNFDIYVKLVDTGDPVRITTNPLVDNRPEWSPDGNYIAFVREVPNSPDRVMYIIPALGGREQKIIKYSAGWFQQPSLSWSHDSKFIFFSSWSTKDSGFVIYRVSIDTHQQEQIVNIPHGILGDQSPRVSSDGKYLAFIRSGPWVGDLYVKDLETGEIKRITNLQTIIEGFSWESDSRSIVFSSNIDGTSALWRTGLESGKLKKLTSGININNPYISKIGNRLVYAETIDNSNIWKIDLKNPKKETLLISSSTFNNMNPAFSPDGSKILFFSNRTGIYNVWICENDGTSQAQLTFFENKMYPGNCKWSLFGSEILLCFPNIGYLLNASGGTPRQLNGIYSSPVWSKDGQGFIDMRFQENNIYYYSRDEKINKQITKGGGLMPLLYDNYIYYVKSWNHHDIWRIPFNGGEEEPVLDKAPDMELRGWGIVKNGIYLVQNKNGTPVLNFYNFSTKRISLVKEVPMARIKDFALIAIDPKENYLLYSKRELNRSDIILVENYK